LKSLVLIILLVNSLLSFDYKLHPKEVSKDIYCFFGLAQVMDKHNNGNMSNSCFVNEKNQKSTGLLCYKHSCSWWPLVRQRLL